VEIQVKSVFQCYMDYDDEERIEDVQNYLDMHQNTAKERIVWLPLASCKISRNLQQAQQWSRQFVLTMTRCKRDAFIAGSADADLAGTFMVTGI